VNAERASIQLRLALAAILEVRSDLYPLQLDHVRGTNTAWWLLSPAIDGIKGAIVALDGPKEEEAA
jgi:hypothetical protein